MGTKEEILLYILENNGLLGVWDIISYFKRTQSVESHILELRREHKIELRPVTLEKGYSYRYFVKGE